MRKKSSRYSMSEDIDYSYKDIGDCRYYIKCRFCNSTNIVDVVDLGNMPLAGGFISKNSDVSFFKNEKVYPLKVSYCKQCFLLQSTYTVDPDILFKNYFYRSSSIKTLVSHFEDSAQEINNLLGKKRGFVVEIGSNDGAFIKSLEDKGLRALGVDPAENIVKNLKLRKSPIINDYFSEKLAKKIEKKYGKADVIASFHTLAHIEDMHDVMRGIKKLLKKDGLLYFEVHYLGNLIREVQYDMIYHEHLYYYSVSALHNFFSRYDMEIVNIKPVQIRGGSMIYYVKNKSDKNIVDPKVKKILSEEKRDGLTNIKTFLAFSDRIERTKKDMLNILSQLKNKRSVINGYGASGRGTVIMNYVGLGKSFLDFVVDDAPAKTGAFTPGKHLEIVSEIPKNSDYLVLFAWPFLKEVLSRNEDYLKRGVKFIVPLPEVKIVDHKTYLKQRDK